jgi:type I restriction enzyme M protein
MYFSNHKSDNMAKEKKSEIIIRNKLKELGYYADEQIFVEEQQSDSSIISKLLSKATKSGSGKDKGYPEYIVRKKNSDVVILVECKSSVKDHESVNKNNPAKYAIDGVLHYASFLKDGFNVIAIAHSGEIKGSDRLSIFQWNKNEKRYFPKKFSDISTYEDYYSLFHSSDNEELSEEELLAYAKKLHDEMRDEAKLKEAEKPLLVGALLLALDNGDFTQEFPSITNPKKLAKRIIEAISDSLASADIPLPKIEKLKREFGFIATHTYLTKCSIDHENPSHDNNTLHKFLVDIYQKVYPFIKKTNNIDIIGQFYSEFLRYTGGDGKGLGIVLTPTHITNLFCELAEVNKNSKVIDICTGTGSFLISAMEFMLNDEPTVVEIDNIYKNNLVGVETQDNMFALACANMIIRGDGKTNLFSENCFEIDEKILKNFGCNIGFINPPYSQKKKKEYELEFVYKMLNILTVGGIGIAIIPQSCAMTSEKENNAIKERILSKHTLKAVMSMPDELFGDGANSVTCIMVFEAHKPHNITKSSWFGYFKDDGFEKIRNKGRIDYKGLFKESIKKKWLKAYFDRSEIIGFSVLKNVTANDEWLVEAYMKTDHNLLSKTDFIFTMKRYVTYKFYNELSDKVSSSKKNNEEINLDISKWASYALSKFFNVKGSKTTPKREVQEIGAGIYPYVTTSSVNNGVEGFYDYFTDEGNILIVDSAVRGVCSYQKDNFTASDHVEKLIPKFNMNIYHAMFFVSIINAEQYRYSYGRKYNQDRIRDTELLVPCIKGTDDLDLDFIEKYIKSLPYSSSL